MVEAAAHIMGLAGPPDEMQLAMWANRLHRPVHELTVEDMESAELMATMEWLGNTLGALEGAKDKVAVMRQLSAKTNLYLSELRKEARKKYGK